MKRERLLTVPNNSTMLYNYISWLIARNKLLLICVLVLGMMSCSKDKRLDHDISTADLSTNSVSYMQSGNVVWLNNKSYNFTDKSIASAIDLTEAVKSADTIVATVDPSLVATYNQTHLETNLAFPEGAFTVVNQGIFPIVANASSATDSLYVLLANGSVLKSNSVYLVPVKLTSKKGAKLKYSTFYFKMTVKSGDLKAYLTGASVFNNIKASRTASGALNMIYISAFPDSLKFSVGLNSTFAAHDTKVEATIFSNAQVDSAIVAQKFSGIHFPDDTYSLTKSVATVGTTSKLGTDSITVSFRNRANFKNYQYYVFGLKLKKYAQSEYGVPPLVSDSATAYIRLFLY